MLREDREGRLHVLFGLNSWQENVSYLKSSGTSPLRVLQFTCPDASRAQFYSVADFVSEKPLS